MKRKGKNQSFWNSKYFYAMMNRKKMNFRCGAEIEVVIVKFSTAVNQTVFSREKFYKSILDKIFKKKLKCQKKSPSPSTISPRAWPNP